MGLRLSHRVESLLWGCSVGKRAFGRDHSRAGSLENAAEALERLGQRWRREAADPGVAWALKDRFAGAIVELGHTRALVAGDTGAPSAPARSSTSTGGIEDSSSAVGVRCVGGIEIGAPELSRACGGVDVGAQTLAVAELEIAHV